MAFVILALVLIMIAGALLLGAQVPEVMDAFRDLGVSKSQALAAQAEANAAAQIAVAQAEAQMVEITAERDVDLAQVALIRELSDRLMRRDGLIIAILALGNIPIWLKAFGEALSLIRRDDWG